MSNDQTSNSLLELSHKHCQLHRVGGCANYCYRC